MDKAQFDREKAKLEQELKAVKLRGALQKMKDEIKAEKNKMNANKKSVMEVFNDLIGK